MGPVRFFAAGLSIIILIPGFGIPSS